MLNLLHLVLAFGASLCLSKSEEVFRVTRPSSHTGTHHGIKDTCKRVSGFLTLESDHVCLDPSLGKSTTNQTPISQSPPETSPSVDGVPVSGWTSNGCVTVLATPGVTTQDEIFCSYTDKNFARGRGISVLTTPEHARALRRIPAFVDPELIENVNLERNPPYYTQQIPNKGVGVIVNRTLHRGDLIFQYSPVFMVHRRTLEIMDDDERRELQRKSIASLPAATQELYMALMGHFGGDRVDDIMLTNSFQTDVALIEDEPHNIVLPETSRMNHDCRPSATYFFSEKLMAHSVYATRTIHAGEELSISYTNYHEPREERRAAIVESWGFPCSCSLCTQTRFLTDQSDKRLKTMSEIEEAMDDWTPQSKVTRSMADTLVTLYQHERLNAYMGTAYAYAALAYNSLKDKDMALKYAALAVDHTMIEGGIDHPDTQEMLSLLRGAEAHWTWGRRV